MSQPFKLYRLQQVDSRLDQAEVRLAAIEVLLQQDTALRAAQVIRDHAKDVQEKASEELRQAELNVAAQEEKVKQNQTALYGGAVRNPKELEDLNLENAALKRYLSVLEDRQLEAMITLEGAAAGLETAQSGLQEAQSTFDQNHASLTAERQDLLEDRERMGKERAASASDLEAQDLEIYESLRKKRAGVAVARMKDNGCLACGANLSSSLAQAARSPSTLAFCDTCGRILFGG